MSIIKTVVTLMLVSLPMVAAAHGIEFHLGYGLSHDLLHAMPYVAGAVIAAVLVMGFVRWQNAYDN